MLATMKPQMQLPTPPQSHPKVIFTQPVLRKCHFNQRTQAMNQTMILGQLIQQILTSGKMEYEIEITSLASALSTLVPRFTKTVGEIIVEFHMANKEEVFVMGKKDTIPYSGHYDKVTDATSFDVQNLPDSLVIILANFIELVRQNIKK